LSDADGPAVTPGRAFLVLVAVLFVLGLVGWLVQGAGDDETVPTVPPTTVAPPDQSTR
jgi:hypothetical protein